jgi:hypothetical protein
VITPEGGKPVTFGKGDLVTFPAGLKANWEVKKELKKHYQLDGNAIIQMLRRLNGIFEVLGNLSSLARQQLKP